MKRKKEKMKRPTILDIAHTAGVSPATVSRVLNDANYPVKGELRTRVREAAQELNYKPNIFSQMLKGISSKEIGIIVPDLINPFYAQLVSAVAKQCVAHGFAPIVCSSFDSLELENRQLDILLRQQVAGVLLSTISEDDSFLEKLNEPDAPPFILFDQSHEGFIGNRVSFNFVEGGYMAAHHLIQEGHRTIVFASHVIDRSSRKLVYEGYRKALAEANIPFREELLLINSKLNQLDSEHMDFSNGQELARMLLNREALPDAVMAINDITAIGLIDALSQQGVRVPQDLSVIGYDNIPFASMVTPPLTTIFQPALETGNKACEMLFERIANPGLPPSQIMIQPKLIIRQSVMRKPYRSR